MFYFGNLIGDTGINNTGVYATLASDYVATKAVADDDDNQVSAEIDSVFDHNRNGIHDELDYMLVHDNWFKILCLLTV